MLHRVSELLTQYGISKEKPIPITNGASGAFIFDIEGKYIAKYARRTEHNTKIYSMFTKEYDFYQLYGSKSYDFIPNIVFQTTKQDELFIVMQKYTPVAHNEWNDDLFRQAMTLCARINSLDINSSFPAFQEESDYGSDYDSYPLTVSYENWQSLQHKFPKDIDPSLLGTMYEEFDAINSSAENLPIPKTICHGDFHPENFLLDGNKMLICDWQTVGLGRGISDVAFFISRGNDMGIFMNQRALIEEYHQSMLQYTNYKIELSDLFKNVAFSNFYVAFKFWAEYLQSSDIRRVLSIYNSMVDSYKILSH